MYNIVAGDVARLSLDPDFGGRVCQQKVTWADTCTKSGIYNRLEYLNDIYYLKVDTDNKIN